MTRLVSMALVLAACGPSEKRPAVSPSREGRAPAHPPSSTSTARSVPAKLRSASSAPCRVQPPCPCGTIRKSERTTYPYPKTRHGEIVWCERTGGVKHGPWRETWPTGKPKAEGRYDAGKRDGVWIEHDLDGWKAERSEYRRGKFHGTWTSWYPSGRIKSVGTYVDGKPVGAWRSWYRDGTLSSEGRWVNGELHGADTHYSRTGKKQDVYLYDHGKLTRHDRYKNGKLVKSRPPRDRTDPNCEPDFDEICDSDAGDSP